MISSLHHTRSNHRMDNLPMDIIRHINGFGAGHREALRRVHQEYAMLQDAYHEFAVAMALWDEDKGFCECQYLSYWEEDYGIKFISVLGNHFGGS